LLDVGVDHDDVARVTQPETSARHLLEVARGDRDWLGRQDQVRVVPRDRQRDAVAAAVG